MGGILTIDVVRAADVVSIPEPVNGAIYDDVELQPGAGFSRWLVGYQSAGFSGKSKTSREGVSKDNEVRFFIPLDRQAVRTMLERAEDDEFIIIYRYATGPRKIFGTKDFPVLFQFDHDSGSAPTDQNGNNCKFYYSGPENSTFYNGAIASAAPGTAPSIVRYSTGEIIATLSPTDILVVNSDFAHTFSIIPGSSPTAAPAIVKWDDDEPIASLQPSDVLVVETDFDFEFEIIGSL